MCWDKTMQSTGAWINQCGLVIKNTDGVMLAWCDHLAHCCVLVIFDGAVLGIGLECGVIIGVYSDVRFDLFNFGENSEFIIRMKGL